MSEPDRKRPLVCPLSMPEPMSISMHCVCCMVDGSCAHSNSGLLLCCQTTTVACFAHHHAACSVQVAEDDGDGSDDGFDLAPTDAEATIMLLRSKLYPDPQKAAAAAAAAAQSRHSKRSKKATGPSKAAAAAITAAAAAKQLPPIVLKSQLYTVLTDRTAADRDLERLRQSQRVRVFKLAIGGLQEHGGHSSAHTGTQRVSTVGMCRNSLADTLQGAAHSWIDHAHYVGAACCTAGLQGLQVCCCKQWQQCICGAGSEHAQVLLACVCLQEPMNMCCCWLVTTCH
jgi:hypothetical protein